MNKLKGPTAPRWSGIALACMALVLAEHASAQDVAETPGTAAEPAGTLAAQTGDGTADQMIVVTGSRIRRNGFSAPTPLTVIGGELISNLGQVNISETLRLIPQNSNFQSDAVAGITAGANVGASFANLRGLNPFSGTRTLTLVNGRRFIPSSDGGAVDLNVIPTAMIKRIETVTGGASAAYGSDAIAGVINVILDTELEGLRAQADYGQTSRDDGRSYHGSLVFGTKFAGGRGHIVIGGEYQDNKGIGDCSKSRRWCAESWDVYTNASNVLPGGRTSGYNVPGSPGDPFPNFVIGPGSIQAFNDPRGVVRDRAPTAIPARNFRFTEDGRSIVPFDPGMFVSSAQVGPRQGGDGISTYDDSDLQTPVRRYVGYAHVQYELSDAVTAETELTYANRVASNTANILGPRSTYFVRAVNAYLPENLRTLLAGTSFSLGKDLDSAFKSLNRAEAEVFRGLVGLKGELGGKWTWNAYYQYGDNKRHQDRTNNRVNTPFQYALDAVRDPGGNIVCAELLKASPDPRAQGCKPLNLFGLDNLDPAAVAYAYRPVVEDFRYRQHVVSGAVQGELYSGWGAGPIGFAAGVDYRDEDGLVTHGNIPDYFDYAFTFGQDFGGKIKVLEGFSELNVPVLKDSALGDALELNGAVRYTRNRSSDGFSGEAKTTKATSWKVSGIYDITGGLRLRASRSRDIRAAGFRELFLKNIPTEAGSVSGIVDNPAIPGSPAGGDDPTPVLTGGSFALNPERADTTTAGAVFSPTFLRGLSVSVDWYQIKIADAITTLSQQGVVNFCQDFTLFCDRITYGGSPADITFIDARQVNLAALVVRGFDLELDYRLRLSDISAELPGTVNFRVLGNNQYDFLSRPTPGAPTTDFAGQTGPVADAGNFNASPRWTWSGFVTYSDARFNVTASVRHIPEGIYNVSRIGPEDDGYDPNIANSINTNRVDAATFVGLAMSYTIPLGGRKDRHVQIFGAVDNLFDQDPPVAPGGGSGGGSNYPTNPVHFDTFGARGRAGIRVSY
jgi:outer membrane receptor protein involved in Fe transport